MWHVSEDVVNLLHEAPATLWLIVSVILLSASVGPSKVGAVHDFAAYRLQHLDLHGASYGNSQYHCIEILPYPHPISHTNEKTLAFYLEHSTDFLSGVTVAIFIPGADKIS